MAQAPFIDPFFCKASSRGKAVVEVDAVADAHFSGFGDHFFAVGNII